MRLAAMVRRDVVVSIRESLAEAAEHLAGRGDVKAQLANARPGIAWLRLHHMPTKGAASALTQLQHALRLLDQTPPAKPGDLALFRRAIGGLVAEIDDYLQHWRSPH
jgi:hypothetical protein